MALGGNVIVGNKEKIIICNESTRNTIGNFASNGIYIGVHPVLSGFSENPRSLKPRVSVDGGLQDETMDPGASSYRFTLTWLVTDFKHMRYIFSDNTEAGSSPYTHTFTVTGSTTSDFFSLQRIKDGGNVIDTYLGCFFTRIKYEWNKSVGDDEAGYIKATATVVASSFDDTVTVKTAGDDTATKTVFTFNEFKATVGNTEKIEVVSGSLDIDTGINPDEFYYCNATNDLIIGTPNPVFFKIIGNLTVNTIDGSLVNEMQQDGISGTNKFEIIKNATNDKIVFTFANMWNLQPFAETNYRGINQASVVYNATLTNAVVTDLDQNY